MWRSLLHCLSALIFEFGGYFDWSNIVVCMFTVLFYLYLAIQWAHASSLASDPSYSHGHHGCVSGWRWCLQDAPSRRRSCFLHVPEEGVSWDLDHPAKCRFGDNAKYVMGDWPVHVLLLAHFVFSCMMHIFSLRSIVMMHNSVLFLWVARGKLSKSIHVDVVFVLQRKESRLRGWSRVQLSWNYTEACLQMS